MNVKEEKVQLSVRADLKLEGKHSAISSIREGSVGGISYLLCAGHLQS